jgi:hypothetical protein
MLESPPGHLWILLGLGLGSACIGGLRLGRRRRRAAARAAPPPGTQGHLRPDHLAPTVEAAELQLALLFRRMRAYLRDPYDRAASRIGGEAEFEACLDLAAGLSLRIGELGGAAAAGPAERERVRGQILDGLMASCRARSGGGGGTPAMPPGARPTR